MVYTMRFEGPVPTVNAERAGNTWKHRASTKMWREAFHVLAKAQRVPHLGRVRVVAQVYQHRSRLQDCGACLPAVKAAIDGIVDAGVLDDDGPEHVVELTFLQPKRGTPALEVTLLPCPAR